MEKKMSCEICNRIFLRLQDLQRHKFTHGNERPYACEECNKSYLRKDNLLMHMRRMHGYQKNEKKENFETIEETVKEVEEMEPRIEMPIEENQKVQNVLENTNNKNKETGNIFSTSSSNRRKQTPTKLKTLEQKLDTLDYVPLSELLTPYLMSEQELHEEFEKAEIEATLSNTNNKIDEEEKRTDMQQSTKELEDKCIEAARPQSANSNSNNFSCHICVDVNFKRRGNLVNHYTKFHAELDLETVEALKKPIIKPQVLYDCCYCKNVYHSSRKRRLHILKQHPGRKLPQNERNIGQKKGEIYKCQICTRQYVVRSCLVTHYRKKHVDAEIPAKPMQMTPAEKQMYEETPMNENKLLKLSSAALELSRYDVYNERSSDEFQCLPSLFDETPLVGMDGLVERYSHRSIEQQFFEKIGKL